MNSLPSPPLTQALSSTTFFPPPLDGSKTLPEHFEWHAIHTRNHRLFVYAKDDGSVRNIYWPEAAQAVRNGASLLLKHLSFHPGASKIVAILALSDTITYFTTIMSIMRANLVPFPISPRNSAPAVAHLLSKVRVGHLLVGRDQSMVDLVNGAMKLLASNHPQTTPPSTSPIPLFEDLFLEDSTNAVKNEEVPYEHPAPEDLALVLHSSGSTAFPKPILWTHHRCAQLALIPWFGQRDLTGIVWSLHTVPMYHVIGVFQICWTTSCGIVIAAFEPKSPAQLPTSESLFVAAQATNTDLVVCVPSLMEAWAHNIPAAVGWLATRIGVLYGGGPLNKEAGDYLTSQGVNIFILYGSTEGGIMSPMLPAVNGYEWDYFRFADLVTSEMVPYGNGTFELVMVSNKWCTPAVLNTKIRGIDSYATSDLFVEHPTKKGYYKVWGRTDDQIMHSTGEKTNPGPLENILNQDPNILCAVMFGRGKFQAGVVVDPCEKFDPGNEAQLAEFRNRIWPSVTRMNEFAPQQSRLFKEMILVSKPSIPFTYTAKNTPRRHAILADYAKDIDAAYDAVEESQQDDIPSPEKWDIAYILPFVRTVVLKVLVHAVKDDVDIFQNGCDSLQATWIKNPLLRALHRTAHFDVRKLTSNFVYEYPTIHKLATFLLRFGSAVDSGDSDTALPSTRVNNMLNMAETYKAAVKTPLNAGSVVLVTGTTGGLGSFILARLLSDPTVSHVYAINRKSGDRVEGNGLRSRHIAGLEERGINVSIIDDETRVTLLEANLSVPLFGVGEAQYETMRDSVTHIIHNAWPVDFNLALTSFEDSIRGLRSLLDFALASPRRQPPKFIYVGSISIFQNTHIDQEPLSESPVEAEVAVGTGYSESKWVAEDILKHVAEKTALKPLVVRVGQLSGGPNGYWKHTEWVPALVQSASVLGCLPTENKNVSWMPMDIAAGAIVDFLNTDDQRRIVHLVHPRPVLWSTLATILATELSVPLVPLSTWVEKLVAAAAINDQLPERVFRLLDFFKDLGGRASKDALGFPKLDSVNAVEMSATLRDDELRTLDKTDVMAWIAYWKKARLIV